MSQNNEYKKLQAQYKIAVNQQNPHAMHALSMQLQKMENNASKKKYSWTSWFKPSGGKSCRRGHSRRARRTRRTCH